jgi:predicted MPP superfamily phosphohydrolase
LKTQIATALAGTPHPSTAGISRRAFVRGMAAAGAGAALTLATGNGLDVVESGTPGAGAAAGGLRIALVTDLHAPHCWVPMEQLASAVKAFDPHLVLIVGDSIDRPGEEVQLRAFDALSARHGKFASLGNHERWTRTPVERLRREYERADVRLLVNESETVDVCGRAVTVVGLDDWRAGTPDYTLLAGSRAPWRQADHRLVLAHCPVSFDTIVRATALPLTALAGHTHGGQIAPFGRPLFLPHGSGSYVKGWYHGDTSRSQHMYVSRGLGNSGPPLRVGARPELALLTL